MPSAVASGSAAATILKTPTFGPTAVRTALISSTRGSGIEGRRDVEQIRRVVAADRISAARFTSANVLASRFDASTALATRMATRSAIAASSLSEICCSRSRC
jgi:hypothetical protein